MKRFFSFILFYMLFETTFSQSLTIFKSSFSADSTAYKLVEVIKQKGLTLRGQVSYDHHVRPKEIPFTRIIEFDEPSLISDLLVCQPTVSLELPLKILVWEEHGDVYLGFSDPAHMKRKYQVVGCDDILAKLTGIHIRIINEVVKVK